MLRLETEEDKKRGAPVSRVSRWQQQAENDGAPKVSHILSGGYSLFWATRASIASSSEHSHVLSETNKYNGTPRSGDRFNIRLLDSDTCTCPMQYRQKLTAK